MKTAESKTCALCPEPPHEDWRELQPGVTHRSTQVPGRRYHPGGRVDNETFDQAVRDWFGRWPT